MFKFSGSIPYIWGILSKDSSKCTGNNNDEELLDGFTKSFQKLDSCIRKHDNKGVEETYGKLLYLRQAMNPTSYGGALHAVNGDCINLLLQDIIKSKKINLAYLDACLKPFFNEWYAVLE